MRNPTTPPADPELAVAALRYAAADMTPADAEAFEARLAADQTARDALAEAVRLSAAASGTPEPTPDPLTRRAVVERLHPTWVSRLFPRRPYRGHPAAWAGLGGGIAAVLVAAVAVNVTADPPVPTIVGEYPTTSTFAASAGTDLDPPATEPPAPRLTAAPPVLPNLNPMGLEKRPGDTASTLYPTPAVPPMPMPAPPAKPGDHGLAEGPNDTNPMGDPHIGMMNSKL